MFDLILNISQNMSEQVLFIEHKNEYDYTCLIFLLYFYIQNI